GEPATGQRVALDDVAGLLAVPDGARHVITQEGWGLTVEPTMWSGGSTAVELLDLLVPLEKHIPVSARDAASVPRPLPVWRRWWFGARRWAWSWPLFVFVVVLGLVVAGVLPPRLLVTVAVAGTFSVWYWRRRDARERHT
ncbi:MAG: hypothetical protein ACRCZP_02580, partial [Phycicoccus sp.]